MPAGLLARGSDASTSLPGVSSLGNVASGVCGRSSPLTVAGAAPEMRLVPIERIGAHRIPIFTGQDLYPAGTFTQIMCSDQITDVKRGRPPVWRERRRRAAMHYSNYFHSHVQI